jgi:outer membrane scaffolding protein for murein synthesis (MipA/OmpV family)
MNLKLGREEKRNPVLSGLGDIADTLLAGAFIEGRYKGLFVSAEFRQALWGGQGTSARFVLAQGLYQSRGKKMTLIAAFRTGWNSRRANQTNFGITPEQSLDSGLAIYAPGSGFTKLEFDLLGRHQIGERWRLDWIAGYAQLIGDATRSPLIATHGTTDQFIVGAGIRYSF